MNTARISSYKYGSRLEESKETRRTEQSVIRRLKKDHYLAKRRKISDLSENSKRKRLKDHEDFDEIQEKFQHDPDQEEKIASEIRKLLENETDPDQVSRLAFNKCLIQLLSQFSVLNSTAKYELLWCLVNITAVAHITTVEKLFGEKSRLLEEIRIILTDPIAERTPLLCLACWILGNLANSSSIIRSVLLRSNIIIYILKLADLDGKADEQFLGTQSWALGCLLQGNNPPVPHGTAIRSLPRLLTLLDMSNDTVKLDVLKALTSFTDFAERCEALASPDFCEKVVKFMEGEDVEIQKLSLYIAGNFISTSEMYTAMLMKSGFLNALHRLSTIKLHKKVYWWCIDSLCASDQSIYYYLMTNTNFVQTLFNECAQPSGIQGIAIRSFCNVLMTSDTYLILRIAVEHCIHEPLISGLDTMDNSLLMNVLSATSRIHTMIEAEDEEKGDDFVQLYDECGGIEKLDEIANLHENEQIASSAARLHERLQQLSNFSF